jgi:hypothetical protein
MFHVHQTSLGSLGQVKMSLNDNGERPIIRLAGFYNILASITVSMLIYYARFAYMHSLSTTSMIDRPEFF